MKTATLLLSLLSLASIPAIAERTLFAEPLASQSIEYERGGAYVTSRSNSTTVILLPRVESGSLATLRFTVFNGSDINFTVFENAVSADTSGKPIEILGASELESKEKRKRFWENVGAGLAAGANSYTAAQQGRSTNTSYQSGTVSAYTPNGAIRGSYQGTTTTQSYDPQVNQQAVSDASRNNAQMLSNLRAEQAARSASLDSAVLRTQTVRPGDSYSGFVQMRLPRSTRGEPSMVDVSFSAGPDTHHFFLFVDGQPTVSQRSFIARRSGRQPPSTGETDEGVAKAESKRTPIEVTHLVKQIPIAPNTDDWAQKDADLVASNCLNNLIAGRAVADDVRSAINFACICMTDKLKKDVSFGDLVAASRKTPAEQEIDPANVSMRDHLRSCAKEYNIDL